MHKRFRDQKLEKHTSVTEGKQRKGQQPTDTSGYKKSPLVEGLISRGQRINLDNVNFRVLTMFCQDE